MTVTDPMEFVYRAQAINVRNGELMTEVERASAGPPTAATIARLDDLAAEQNLLVANMREIRLEQIQWQLGEHPDQLAAKARPWWRCWG